MKTTSLLLLTCLSISLCLNAQNPDAKGTFTDPRDNKTYKTIKIGEQTWMAENLAYLPKVNPPTEGSDTEPYYYVYDYNDTNIQEAKATDNYKTYGVLYNWAAAKKVCPKGWHLPSDDEWDKLAAYISSDKNTGSYFEGYDCWTEIGKILKSKAGWYKNSNGTDDYGFSAVPGGYHNRDRTFNNIGCSGNWWSSTEYSRNSSNYVYYRQIYYYNSPLDRRDLNKEYSWSVRCVRD